jgi:hypothetical protein
VAVKTLVDGIELKILRNTFQLVWEDADGDARSVEGLGICGHIGLVNRHYGLKPGKYLLIRSSTLAGGEPLMYEIYLDEAKSVGFGSGDDVYFWDFGMTGHAFKDIRHLFTKYCQGADIERTQFLQRIGLGDSQLDYTTVHDISFDPDKVYRLNRLPGIDSDIDEITNFIEAVGSSKPGACGRPYIALDGPMTGQIFGIHSGRNSLCVTISYITQEDLNAAVQYFHTISPMVTRDETPLPCHVDSQCSLPFKTAGYIEQLGRVPPDEADHNYAKSVYREMPTHNLLGPVNRVPTPLGPQSKLVGEEFKAGMFDRVSTKGDRPTKWSDDATFVRAAIWLGEHLRKEAVKRGSSFRTLTSEEAINVTDDPGSKHVDPNTGIGYKWRKTYPGQKGKWAVLEVECEETGNHYTISEEDFQKAVDKRVELARKGVIPGDSLWSMKIKPDELRPLAKVKEGKARVIRMAPFDFSVVATMFFGSLRNFLVSCDPLDSMIAMGIAPLDLWRILGPELQTCEGVFGVDFTNYDDSQPQQMYQMLIIVLDKFFDDAGTTTSLVRKVLCYEACHATYIWHDEIRRDDHGNPSGFPGAMTTIMNSVINILISLVAWYRRTGLNFDDFKEHMILVTMGDDNIQIMKRLASWSCRLKPLYNRGAIVELAAEIGMIATDAAKSGIVTDWDDPTEVSFLKQTFRYDHDFGWVPAMSEETIFGLLNWFRSGGGNKQILTNIQEALRFATGHGREYYNWLRTGLMSLDMKSWGIDTRNSNTIWSYEGACCRVYDYETYVERKILFGNEI